MFSYLIVVEAMGLTATQTEAQHFSIDDVQGNPSGYVQVTAVLIWAPCFFEAVKETISKLNPLPVEAS